MRKTLTLIVCCLLLAALVSVTAKAQLNCSGGYLNCTDPASFLVSVQVAAGKTIGWADATFARLGANRVGLQTGTSPQEFDTFGDASKYSFLKHDGTNGQLGISHDATLVIGVNAFGGNYWQFNGSSASYNFAPSASNAQDLCGSGATCRNLYLNGNAGGNAAAGAVGEYSSSTLATGSSVTLATGSASPITSISLTAGDWDVSGVVDYTANAATSVTILSQGVLASNTCSGAPALGAQDTYSKWETAANVIGASDPAWVTPTTRVSIASTTTVCLVAQATFSVNSLKAYGTIRARRMR